MGTEKALETTIEFAGLEFQGLMLPDGSYRIAQSQLADLNLVPRKRSQKQLKALYGEAFQTHEKIASELNSRKVNVYTLEQFSEILMVLAFAGNAQAQRMLLASNTEKFERVFDKAFGVIIDERERDARFAARLDTKANFRPLTDELKRHGFTEGWQYGRFIKAFQDEIGFESGQRDQLDITTLIKLGNSQSELRILMGAGYEPYEALEVWKVNRLKTPS